MRIEDDTAAAQSRLQPRSPRPVKTVPELPGCRPMTLRRRDLDACDGRFEYWDGDVETVWVVREPTSDTHELPSHRLAGLVARIAEVRGSPITCYGAMDLVLRDERGERRRILQADQVLYLHPGQGRLPEGAGMMVGEHDFPDVVLEVDHTTDVRRGKLGLYEEWGFPEVWVEVPDRYSPHRPAGRRPGLTVYVLKNGVYQAAAASRAFPGWRAEEMHTALNEAEMSEATGEVLSRVGRALGAREGTGPDDMPWLRMQRQEARAGAVEAFARKVLASRGMGDADLRIDPRDLAGISDEAVFDALMQCDDALDFRARIRGLHR